MSHAGDTRVLCTDCAELSPAKTCRVVARGEWIGRDAVLYPPLEAPSHCICFAPRPQLEDQRGGRERFPHAFAAIGARANPEPAMRGIAAARQALVPGGK